MSTVAVLDTVRDFLLAQSAITTLLGVNHAQVHVARVPSKVARPYIVLHLLDEPGSHHLGGASRTRATLVQIECWADTSAAAQALADAVEVALDGVRGTMGSIFVKGALKRARRGPTAEALDDGGQAPAWNAQADYNFWTTAA